ncbi:MAG: hypothetical protein ACR2O6_11340 [Ilumatobacteraceae bacterium]
MENQTDIARPTPPAPSGTRRELTAGHIVALVAGVLLLFPALGMTAGGALTLVGQAVATDDDGYFEFTLDRIATDGVAITATDLRLDGDAEATDWLLDWLDVDVRLRVDGAATTDDVFVGIARSADVERYLAGSAHSEIVEVDGRSPFYEQIDGVDLVESPLAQDFWSATASGAEVQELTWEARAGRWSVVVMNADGSPAVAADVEVGARSGAVTPIGITLLAVGGVTLIAAVVLIVVGARGRNVPDRPEADAAPTPGPGTAGPGNPLDPPATDTAVQLDDDVRTPAGVA